MARHKRNPPHAIARLGPVGTIGPGAAQLPGISRRDVPVSIVRNDPNLAWIGSEDPPVYVVGRVYKPATARPPRPRYEQTPRPGTKALNRYAYHDGYEQQIPLLFDHYADGRSVEPMIRRLESLARRIGANGEPPVVQVIGPIPYATERSTTRWRVSEIAEDDSRVIYLPGGLERCRFACTVTLIEHVTDKQLAESIRRGKRAQGIRNRQVHARQGDYLSDVSRREYGDPSRAGDIARANPGLRLGQRLKAGQTIRLPA